MYDRETNQEEDFPGPGKLGITLQWTLVAAAHLDEHNVSPLDAEDVAADEESRIVKSEVRGRYVLYGRTRGGRYIKLFVDWLGKQDYRPVTGWQMDDTDRRRYRSLQGKK